MCGKNENGRRITSFGSGSPPRVREKQLLFLSVRQHHRITPACAGKTRSMVYRQTSLQDHPRVCGKNVSPANSPIRQPGSPPRVREKPCQPHFESNSSGITPACAGKTLQCEHLEWLHRDHPRVCGKNGNGGFLIDFAPGSPPRVREKL